MKESITLAPALDYDLRYMKQDGLWIVFVNTKTFYIRTTRIGKAKYYFLNGKHYKRLRDSIFTVLLQELQPF